MMNDDKPFDADDVREVARVIREGNTASTYDELMLHMSKEFRAIKRMSQPRRKCGCITEVTKGLEDKMYDILRDDVARSLALQAASEGLVLMGEVEHAFLDDIFITEDNEAVEIFKVHSWAYCEPIIDQWQEILDEENQ